MKEDGSNGAYEESPRVRNAKDLLKNNDVDDESSDHGQRLRDIDELQ